MVQQRKDKRHSRYLQRSDNGFESDIDIFIKRCYGPFGAYYPGSSASKRDDDSTPKSYRASQEEIRARRGLVRQRFQQKEQPRANNGDEDMC